MKSLRIVEQVSINKMIAEFLRNNLHQIKKEDVTNFKILEQPDIKDIKENKLRWNLFSDKFWLFVRFLPQCDWFECEITLPESFKNIRIIEEESWKNNLFSGEHLVENINIEKFEEDNHFLKINQFFQNNIEKFINEKYIIGIENMITKKLPSLTEITDSVHYIGHTLITGLKISN